MTVAEIKREYCDYCEQAKKAKAKRDSAKTKAERAEFDEDYNYYKDLAKDLKAQLKNYAG